MEASIALSLSYRDLHIKNNQALPFYLSFPDKNLASVWLSISLLTNFFFEDYVYQTGIEQVDSFLRGDKIEIFGAVAKIETVSPDKITLEFSDQGGIPINKRLRSQISKTSKKLVNKKSLFINNYKASKTSRNPVSKILEPNEPLTINDKHLTSQVLMITGRGNIKKLRDILRTSEIYNEPLNKIFIEDKNLLIEKDLESFKSTFTPPSSDKDRLFKELLLDFLKTETVIELSAKENLINHLESGNFLTTSFKEELEDLVEIYSESFPQLTRIYQLHPGIRETVPANIKAVIINDIEQIDVYKSAISGFLRCGIPVFVISDRYIQNFSNLGFLNAFFSKNPLAHRINWNRKKINILRELSDSKLEYLDKTLWNNCCRYADQKIMIKVTGTCELDKLLYESQKIVKGLDEFETIQKCYYRYLFPAIYLFKNSGENSSQIFKLTELFCDELKKNKIYLEERIGTLLQQIVDFLKPAVINTKVFSLEENIFSNILPVELGSEIFIPSGTHKLNIPDQYTKKILFTGYPYNEFSGKYLIDAVCSKFVPEIELLCWTHEAELTYNYLKRRILAGYFTDHTEPEWNIPETLLLKNSDDFTNEVNTFLFYENCVFNEPEKYIEEQEQNILAITNFKYKGYNQPKDSQSFSVKCDILNFNDGSFLFLPKNSRVLAQMETPDGSLKFKNALFSELEIGCKVFKYKKDRNGFRELAKNNSSVRKALTDLEIWKDTLVNLFVNSNHNLDSLTSILSQTKIANSLKGNPSRNNIQRWLFDDELIAPDTNNLKIILYAAGIKDADIVGSNMEFSRRIVYGYSISLSSIIKNNIMATLRRRPDRFEKEFELIIDSVSITVENRIITGLEGSQIDIEYHNTRKILG